MKLPYKEYGDKSAPLMVFLHGGGVSDWMWDKQVEYFTHYHCIVPIFRGHGLHNDEMPFSIKGSAEEIITLIEEKAEGKKVILNGFSLGSQVIIQLLSMKPKLIDFAIINSASVRPMAIGKKLIKPTIQLSFPLIKNKYFSKLQAKTLYVSEDYFERYYEESCQIKLDTLVRVLEENMSFGIPEDFKRANTKILVTVGEKEKSIMIKSAREIVAANTNCTGIIIPKVGHGVSLAKPDYFNHMVEDWLQKGTLPEDGRVIG
ncbi:alpha/beta fold hydrolase [Sutcliffiella rhizosphaerae]|uniref:2-succinyl-6-hydroxy-2, 4-cyclohexadiene-1-carboxylate synthase n=1 Tax=Sutcliffiella rhizosphaerae TaxID=2880967 RepID=A0ABN8AA82_9BACI|nr:alpha/beta hydrolase [Sutcliffiella rhizosphaerae]CAG9620332.1 2-succinyl-6-hydroxy-2, 4-cyclohexadiene-1-carboxylate synthase [Sutcliffiella rhizosphaerae]